MNKEKFLALLEAGEIDAIKTRISENRAQISFVFEHNKSLLHYAAKYGSLDLVQFLLQEKPDLLEVMDTLGQTALLWAAAQGHTEIVECFVSEGADLHHETYSPNHEYHGRTAIDWAMLNRHYATASALVHAHPEKNVAFILNRIIQTSQEAVEFLIADDRNRVFISQIARLKALAKAELNISETHYHYYKTAGRRPSFYAEIDRKTWKATVFNKTCEIGRGGGNTVFKFSSQTNEHRVVRYPKYPDASEALRRKKAQAIQKAFYPDTVNQLFFFTRHVNSEKRILIRDVEDYIEGETLATFFPKIKKLEKIAVLFLNIVADLIEFHQTVIHGDIKASNIMMESKHGKFAIKWIDFDESYRIHEKSATMFDKKDADKNYLAPERYEAGYLRPHPSQDTYSLGAMFWQLISKHKTIQKEEIFESFPSIKQFIYTALSKQPERRPTLRDFYSQLRSEFEANRNQDALTSKAACMSLNSS